MFPPRAGSIYLSVAEGAAHASVTPKDLERRVKIYDRDATVDGMYLRIIVHANEHMGQLIAYARMTGVVPPWSQKQSKESPEIISRDHAARLSPGQSRPGHLADHHHA